MPTTKTLLRLAGYTVLLAVISAVCVIATKDARAQDTHVEFEILGVACTPGTGQVEGLQILVVKPGIMELHWHNKVQCGEKS